MATCNGALYLDEQLDSLSRQTHPDIDVWVSDDGSTDETLHILEQWRQRWTKGGFTIVFGPQAGFAENFRSLLVLDDVSNEYLAFCDQDDIWLEDRLEQAIRWMNGQNGDGALLHCTRTITMSSQGVDEGFSPLFEKLPSFRNALVQSIAGANTMLLNRAAYKIVAKASLATGFVSHDWWTYMLVTGVGGQVHYSGEPSIRYRQHAGNQVGANRGFKARLMRWRMLANGRFAGWTERNVNALQACRALLTEEAQALLDIFARARHGNLLSRLSALRATGVYRQTRLGQIGLYVAVILHKL